MLFETLDKSGRLIYLTHERWKHIVREHPLLVDKIEYIKETLIKPMLMNEGKYDNKRVYYYKYYKNVEYEGKFLLVVVRYLNGKGFIITSYLTDKIK